MIPAPTAYNLPTKVGNSNTKKKTPKVFGGLFHAVVTEKPAFDSSAKRFAQIVDGILIIIIFI